MEVNHYELGKKLNFHSSSKWTRKCRIYCENIDVDMRQYQVHALGLKVVYMLPIDLAIGITENVRMSNPNRGQVLKELYAIKGETVVTQLPQRKELVFIDELESVLKELGISLLKQHNVKDYLLDAYIPSKNIAIEFDEFHHSQYEESDRIRQGSLEDSGIKVLRIPEEFSLGKAIGLVVKELSLFGK